MGEGVPVGGQDGSPLDPGRQLNYTYSQRGVAQSGSARSVWDAEVPGSNPGAPTDWPIADSR